MRKTSSYWSWNRQKLNQIDPENTDMVNLITLILKKEKVDYMYNNPETLTSQDLKVSTLNKIVPWRIY